MILNIFTKITFYVFCFFIQRQAGEPGEDQPRLPFHEEQEACKPTYKILKTRFCTIFLKLPVVNIDKTKNWFRDSTAGVQKSPVIHVQKIVDLPSPAYKRQNRTG